MRHGFTSSIEITAPKLVIILDIGTTSAPFRQIDRTFFFSLDRILSLLLVVALLDILLEVGELSSSVKRHILVGLDKNT